MIFTDLCEYRFVDRNNNLPAIESITLTDENNSLGLEADDISSNNDLDIISVNVEDLNFAPGD